MALSDTEKQKALRKRRAALGLKRKEFWLTESEILKVVEFIRGLRSENIKH